MVNELSGHVVSTNYLMAAKAKLSSIAIAMPLFYNQNIKWMGVVMRYSQASAGFFFAFHISRKISEKITSKIYLFFSRKNKTPLPHLPP